MKGQYWLVTQSLLTFPKFALQLKAAKVDAQPDQAQDLSRTSRLPEKKKGTMYFFRATTELTDVGRLFSLTTNSNSETMSSLE